jgi:hypothetical protein
MNLHIWLAALFILLGLAGCVQAVREPGQPPSAPYPYNDDGRMDRSRDMM